MSAPTDRIDACVERLRRGALVAFPTETVYGLGAVATDERAVARVFSLKGRPAHNPLIVHVDSPEMARAYVAHWPERAQRLASAFWPGALTLVLARSGSVPDLVTGGGETVGVRCPDHPLALALIGQLGEGLVGPSANPSGGVSPTTGAHVRASFSEDEVLVLDGGPCRAGIESTVLDLTRTPARVLRPGVIGSERIGAVLGEDVLASASAAGGEVRSPGLLGPHYAPNAPVRLFGDQTGLAELLRSCPGGAVVLSRSAMDPGPDAQVLRLPSDAPGYAAALYSALREADALAPALIAVERPPDAGGGGGRGGAESAQDRAIWAAVLDRLTRATKSPDYPSS